LIHEIFIRTFRKRFQTRRWPVRAAYTAARFGNCCKLELT
jgi:hypothetical protein